MSASTRTRLKRPHAAVLRPAQSVPLSMCINNRRARRVQGNVLATLCKEEEDNFSTPVIRNTAASLCSQPQQQVEFVPECLFSGTALQGEHCIVNGLVLFASRLQSLSNLPNQFVV